MGYTLTEFAKTVKDPFRRGVILTIATEMPFLQYPVWKTIGGLAYAYSRNEQLPLVQFRKLNEAFVATKGITNRYTEPLKILGNDSDTDIELVKAYGMSERTSRDRTFLTAMGQTFGKYFFYGNCGDRAGSTKPYDDADAFDGLVTRMSSGQEVDATGTSTSAGSSVFAIRFGDPYCMGLQSHDIDARDLKEVQDKPVYRTRVDWTPGLAVFHGKAIARIKNLDTTKTLECDHMDQLKDKIVGRRPTCYVMSSRSLRQLKQDAKTAGISLMMTLNSLGDEVESWNGRPIVVDDDLIIDTEDNTK
jgi:hypothetical protein